jgi:hypothetical protein
MAAAPANPVLAASATMSASEPRHCCSVVTISRAWANDSSPAANAAAVTGQSCNPGAMARYALASPREVPPMRASQSTASPDGSDPHAATRAASRTRNAPHAFSVRASASPTAAASIPDNEATSTSAQEARNDDANEMTDDEITDDEMPHLLHASDAPTAER